MASTFFLAFLAVSGAIVVSGGQTSYSGSLVDIDVNHHTINDLVKKLPSLTNEMNGLEIVKVVRALVQVVSGFRYVLTLQMRNKGSNGPATKECTVSVWVQNWLDKSTITDFDCNTLYAQGVPGAWQEVAVDEVAKKAAGIALELINGGCNCMYRKIISRITKVKRQVVKGVLQRITLELIDSSCRNSEQNQWKNLQECPAIENALAKECEITIIWQAWQSPEYRLISDTCH